MAHLANYTAASARFDDSSLAAAVFAGNLPARRPRYPSRGSAPSFARGGSFNFLPSSRFLVFLAGLPACCDSLLAGARIAEEAGDKAITPGPIHRLVASFSARRFPPLPGLGKAGSKRQLA
jgi:hypothetical protein